jgi:hypothetical protein
MVQRSRERCADERVTQGGYPRQKSGADKDRRIYPLTSNVPGSTNHHVGQGSRPARPTWKKYPFRQHLQWRSDPPLSHTPPGAGLRPHERFA